jgi:hypothetical protein
MLPPLPVLLCGVFVVLLMKMTTRVMNSGGSSLQLQRGNEREQRRKTKETKQGKHCGRTDRSNRRNSRTQDVVTNGSSLSHAVGVRE